VPGNPNELSGPSPKRQSPQNSQSGRVIVWECRFVKVYLSFSTVNPSRSDDSTRYFEFYPARIIAAKTIS
jgi:hypothetical protein